MPKPLGKLIALLLLEIQRLTDRLSTGAMSLQDWYRDMSGLMARGHTAALIVGQGSKTVTPKGKAELVKAVQVQIKFLERFHAEIQDTAEFQAGWKTRAATYALSTKGSYWAGRTKMLPLPAMPGDGNSACLNRCTCSWRIVEVNGDQGDWDCYWELGSAENHCQTCPQRASEWNPLQIREGELQ